MKDMPAKTAATVRLVIFVVLALGCLHLVRLPPAPDQADVAARARDQLAYFYMAGQLAEAVDTDAWLGQVRAEVTPDTGLVFVDALAILFAAEGKTEDLSKLLEEWPNLPNAPVLKYAAGLTESLPAHWQDDLAEDLFGRQLAVLVFTRQGDESRRAGALFELRHRESEATRKVSLLSLSYVFKLLGMGFLMSMYITSRQFKRLGRTFFALKPLYLPLSLVLRFTAGYLAGHVLIEQGFAAVLGGRPYWLRASAAACAQAGLAWFLLQHMVMRAAPKADLPRLMGLGNLKMRFGTVFQIIGGLAILHACKMITGSVALQIAWPYDRVDPTAHLEGIGANPLAGGIYLLTACVLLAVLEEVVFRGLIFRSLLAYTAPWKALLLSAALYAVLDPTAYWPVSLGMGFGLALIYYRSGSLLVGICVHALWRCSVLLLAMMGIIF